MALLNKLFSSRKSHPNRQQQSVSDKQFAFNKDQVRLLLFRECDFRGRKLLFDSKTVEKVVLSNIEQPEKFVEISNGHGYMYTKSNCDYNQMSEMVFGSVAMSFRGTYFKIHSLSSPSRLMFTQVFPSPHTLNRKRLSVSSQHSRISSRSFEHSFKLDDSGQSSTTSMSERLSERSTASDTVLVCRRPQSSPLDVPHGVALTAPSTVVDSGCADHSYSSFSTGPLSSVIWESVFSYRGVSTLSFSSCNLLRRMLRSSSRSLERSWSSLNGSGSTENCLLPRPHCRQSKLGLVFILEIPFEKERNITCFFMEHIALIEAMIWRTRNAVEFAYHRPATFTSLMMKITEKSAKWLVDLLTAPRIVTNLWQYFANGCDNVDRFTSVFSCYNEKSEKDVSRTLTTSTSALDVKDSSEKKGLTSSFSGFSLPKLERPEFLSSFSKFLRTEWDTIYNKKGAVSNENSLTLANFLKDFCEILEAVDVKDTNFFMSTLLTAILTHHLGWVATCLPSSHTDTEILCNLKNPYNPLWGQLSDLFGAAGYPVKTAQTVVTGSNDDMVPRILNVLTYFIRCSNVERKYVERCDIRSENKKAEVICHKNDSIPQENYKKYEDHLKDMLSNEQFSSGLERLSPKSPDINKNTFSAFPPLLKKTNTQTVLTDLVKKVSSEVNTSTNHNSNKFYRVPTSISSHKLERKSTLTKVTSFSNLNQLDIPTIKTTELNLYDTVSESAALNVTFVLGENEELVGLKKSNSYSATDEHGNESKTFSKIYTDKPTIHTRSLRKRPTSLSIAKVNGSFHTTETVLCKTENPTYKLSTGCDYEQKSLGTSYSLESLPDKQDKESPTNPLTQTLNEACCSKIDKQFCRSQSEPPENRTSQKFQYSRVKFDLQRYPQVVTNYMKSKNLELGDLPLDGKLVKFGDFSCVTGSVKMDFSGYGSDSEELESLQTPSNASELEFTSDIGPPEIVAEDRSVVPKEKVLKYEGTNESFKDASRRMKIVNIPMPLSTSQEIDEVNQPLPYTSTVMKGLVNNYVPDMVLQGTTDPKNAWEYKLKSNLALTTEHSLLDQLVEESVAIVANTDTWEVEVISSHTFVTDKGASGIRVGMSQLVASMLDSLLHMWKLQMPPQYCIMHIERRLQELCIRSQALAQLLLASEFCTMELLTSSLHLEVNDVPLLLAVASTHTPQVTQKFSMLGETTKSITNGIILHVEDLQRRVYQNTTNSDVTDTKKKKMAVPDKKKLKKDDPEPDKKKQPYFTMFMSELLGTGLLMFLGCMGCAPQADAPPAFHHMSSLSFGLVVLLIIQSFGHISGAHLNPAVTIATVIFKMLSPAMGVVYIAAQFAGAVLGFGLLKILMPADWVAAGFCVTKPHSLITNVQALVIEIIITCVLILVCCGVWDKKNESKQDSTPLRFGLIVAAISMVAGPLTGASMNTARSFAPAVLEGYYDNQWIYWIGPNMGAIIACGVYTFLFTDKQNTDDTDEDIPMEEEVTKLTQVKV